MVLQKRLLKKRAAKKCGIDAGWSEPAIQDLII
jgi:hypothetical protein